MIIQFLIYGKYRVSYNADLVKEPIDSWKNLWNPEYKNSVLLNDDMREVLVLLLKF